MTISPAAGKLPDPSILVDVPKLIAAYYSGIPDPSIAAQKVSFGTSGHRGTSFNNSFNEWHIIAICKAISVYRQGQGIDGPLYMGIDTHALSLPALHTAMEVLAAENVQLRIAKEGEFTPTPVISHAILTYNKGRTKGLADGIVITPSHNPPKDCGIKYNPPNGGPADVDITNWIQDQANEWLVKKVQGIARVTYAQALAASTTQVHDYIAAYVGDLHNVIDMDILKASQISMGVDPLGGAGVHYWGAIGEKYGLNLSVVRTTVDPTFRFMTVDWDGQIRMDPSSPYAMRQLIQLKDRYTIAFACDTDHDRHGIVTRSVGLMPPNHYLTVAIWYLFQNRPTWSSKPVVAKTVVSSQTIDRVAKMLQRSLYEVPVGFKWFVDGLLDGNIGFCGEESAGASFLRRDGSVWTTDKDGIIAALLAGEMTAKLGRDPGQIYQDLTKTIGNPAYDRIDAHATPQQKELLKKLSPDVIKSTELAGEKITRCLTQAPGNHASIGGLKVETENAWFAARPSGTEDIYKIYGESFKGQDHLKKVLSEAQKLVDSVLHPLS